MIGQAEFENDEKEPVNTAPAEEDHEDPAIIQEALSMGWTPREEWKGDPSKWRSAAEFVERGKEILPIVNKRLEQERQRSAQLERELQEMRATLQEFREYSKRDKERMYKRALEELKAKKKQALEEGDADAVLEIDDAILELRESNKKALEEEKPTAPTYDPTNDVVYQTWLSENRWYGTDVELTYYADAIGRVLAHNNPELKGRPFLDAVKQRLREQFPEKFDNPRRKIATVEGTSVGTASSKLKRTYENLPPDAKAACDRFVKQGLMTREEYVAEYDWE
jgi:DNA repair exonuclease SbcCD ATPase subunit